MPRVPYTKPATTYPDQLQQLTDRGLIVSNTPKSLFLLENISYYRLSGYWYPLLADPKSAHKFKEGATFEMAFSMYCFDRELRKLVIAELEKIEVAIRSKMIYILSHQYGSFWFNQPALFIDPTKHNKTLIKLKDEFDRSDEQFLKSFKKNYSDPLPPSWMLLEITSIGGLSHLYKNLKAGRPKRDIANYFGLDSTTFESWLHSFVYIRNICAHHARLWNRVMRITPVMPANPRKTWLAKTYINSNGMNSKTALNDRSYYTLSMIVYLLNVINPKHTFKDKIIDLLIRYRNIDPSAMGFPSEWMDENLWQ